MKIILTGATGMVGNGALISLLKREDITGILSISRKLSGISNPKLKEVILKDFYDLSSIANEMRGYDAVLFCLGISSVGLSKEEYFKITHTLTLHFAETFKKENPNGKFCYISGAGTDSKEKGNGWAAVKGKTENDLIKLFEKNAYNFRPAFMKPVDGQSFVNKWYPYFSWMNTIFKPVFPYYFGSVAELANAMANVAKTGYPSQVLETKDIAVAAKNI